jgi:hypothetical protein
MQNSQQANLPFKTSLTLRPEPPPRTHQPEPPQPFSASRLRRLALLVF